MCGNMSPEPVFGGCRDTDGILCFQDINCVVGVKNIQCSGGQIRRERGVDERLIAYLGVCTGTCHHAVKTGTQDTIRQHGKRAAGANKDLVTCRSSLPDGAHMAFRDDPKICVGAVNIKKNGAGGVCSGENVGVHDHGVYLRQMNAG